MSKFYLPMKDLLSASCFVAKSSDSRKYLQHVFVHKDDDQIKIIGTDGNALLRITCDNNAQVDNDLLSNHSGNEGFILGVNFKEIGFKIKGDVWLIGDSETKTINFVHGDSEAKCQFDIFDGQFPAYDKVMSNDLPGGERFTFGLNPEYILKYHKALRFQTEIRHCSIGLKTGVTTNDPISVSFSQCPNMTGVLMPMKGY